jgi:hypothetical protein
LGIGVAPEDFEPAISQAGLVRFPFVVRLRRSIHDPAQFTDWEKRK